MSRGVRWALLVGLILLIVGVVASIATSDVTPLLFCGAAAIATVVYPVIRKLTGGMKGPPGPYGGGVR